MNNIQDIIDYINAHEGDPAYKVIADLHDMGYSYADIGAAIQQWIAEFKD